MFSCRLFFISEDLLIFHVHCALNFLLNIYVAVDY